MENKGKWNVITCYRASQFHLDCFIIVSENNRRSSILDARKFN